ncbi:MAG: glycosyltransferase [Syntrophobacterales bacterium]|jgi:rhamnosyltransferase
MISVIIRTKNEERWIRPCLQGVLSQKVDLPIEVVLVDNLSADKTVDRARSICPELKLVQIRDFLPGLALNQGIRASSGDYLVCLSAHCPPVDDQWLANLLRNLDDPEVAGVYGRQVPVAFSQDSDKRDLLLTFGLDRRVQVRDTFFHNANSMIPRAVWEKYPFDESVTNIEDRVWGKEVIQAGFKIIYEPNAAVYHYHGIHQNNREDRARSILRIIESRDLGEIGPGNPLAPESLEIAAVVPLRGMAGGIDFSEKLVAATMQALQGSKYINRILVSTDSPDLASMAKSMGAETPFLRPPELSAPGVRVDDVLKHFLTSMEKEGYFPDILVPMEITYPFRPPGLVNGVIEKLLQSGLDTIVAGLPEYRACWKRLENGDYHCLTEMADPRAQREPVHIGVPGLACASYPEFIRQGTRTGGRLGIFEINDPLAGIEIRSPEHLEALETRLNWRISD